MANAYVHEQQVNLPVEPASTKLKLQLYDGEAVKGLLISEALVDVSDVLSSGEQDGMTETLQLLSNEEGNGL